MTIKICDVAFEPFSEIQTFQNALALNGKFGATSIFIGTMRDFNDGDDVQAMMLEHYDGMTQKQLTKWSLPQNLNGKFWIFDCASYW